MIIKAKSVATKVRAGHPLRRGQAKAASRAVATREPAAPVSETEALINAITRASKDPKVDIAKMDWLLKTRMSLLNDEAEQAFNEAMTAAQMELEPIRRDATNPQTKSRYASYPALDAAIRPIYIKHGFALSFDTADSTEPMTVVVVCYVTRGRHKRTYSIPMPADGKGPKGGEVMTRTHATGSAVTYGKRYLLGMIFNVVVADRDDDGNAAGQRHRPVEPESPLVDQTQIDLLTALMRQAEVPEKIILDNYEIPELSYLTVFQFNNAVSRCKAKLKMMNAAMQENSSKEHASG